MTYLFDFKLNTTPNVMMVTVESNLRKQSDI